MRVLMIGGGERYHLEPLARCIKQADKDVWLGVNDLREPKAGGVVAPVVSSPYFDTVYHSPGALRSGGDEGVRPSGAGKPVLPGDVQAAPWSLVAKAAWRLFRRRFPRSKVGRHFARITGGIDVLHVQSLFVGPSTRWLISSGRRGYLVSCWGSDVLRRSGIEDHVVQQQVLRRAAAISASTPELQEIVLAKYGRELEPKLVTTFFNPGVENLREQVRPADEIARVGVERPFRVCIGHNGFEGGNHERLLSGFAALPTALKSRMELILPLTYGGSSEYRSRVRKAAENTGCGVRVLESFLDEAAILRLRAETDILVFAPASDALSATVTQALACSSMVICGAWLSYRARSRAGFHYREIETPEGAAAEVGSVIAQWADRVPLLLRNRELAFQQFSEQQIGEGWIEAYRKVLTSSTSH